MRRATKVLGVVLAGGEGKRLMPLTAPRAKPAVPFGGSYRLIDFVLSNLVNSGIMRVAVLTQYKSSSLDRHISLTWRMSAMLGNYVISVPAQQRLGPQWYQGSADAVFQSLNFLDDERPDYVAVFGADHVYRMDASQMLDAHIASGVALTVAGIRVPRASGTDFGVIATDPSGRRIESFLEKPADPPGLPDAPEETFASMGNYMFTSEALVDALHADASDDASTHDMGGDLVPRIVRDGGAGVYDFVLNEVPGTTDRDRGYWRDVGTIDSYHDAHMDLVSIDPAFNLYNRRWPILSHHDPLPGAKFVEGGRAHESIVAAGCILAGAVVDHSVLATGVDVRHDANVAESVLFNGVQVGRGATVRRAILDKNVVVPDGVSIGVDHAHDVARGFTVSPGGVTVVAKGVEVPAG